MKKIVITGGKGGTGKSTYSVLLANRLISQGKRIILVDCDVECPNDHLLLGKKLDHPKSFVYAKFPVLDKKKCIKCGKCVEVCRSHAVFQAPGQYPKFLPELCSACGACWGVCPVKAIKTKRVRTGQIFINKINKNFTLITGLAKPALEETGPVVLGVKEYALKIAEKQKADVILFDTAAGTHCPVITALLDCDFSYVVTEPTPMGNYDLRLILDLLKKLKIRAEIVLNQADLGDKSKIKEVLKEFKIKKIFEEIPYSKKLVKAYSQGKLLGFKI